jgi:hypothetical protein
MDKATKYFYIQFFRGSPNIEMDEQTFLVNRERAVDYLNSLDKVSFYYSHTCSDGGSNIPLCMQISDSSVFSAGSITSDLMFDMIL